MKHRIMFAFAAAFVLVATISTAADTLPRNARETRAAADKVNKDVQDTQNRLNQYRTPSDATTNNSYNSNMNRQSTPSSTSTSNFNSSTSNRQMNNTATNQNRIANPARPGQQLNPNRF